MKRDVMEQDLKARFDDLRRYDAERVPSFEALCRPAVKRPAPFASPWLRTAAAAALVMLLAGPVLLPRCQEDVDAECRSWLALSEWKAGTDTLLNLSAAGWTDVTGAAVGGNGK